MIKQKVRYFKIYSQYVEGGYSAKVGPFGTTILVCLCFHKNNKNGDCFPSELTIASEMGITRNTVRK